jgi:hypothetical protein
MRGALRRGNQGGVLQLRLSIFKVRSWAVGQLESARFSGGAVGLKQRVRRAMIGGAHLSAGRLEVRTLPTMEAETGWGASVARGPAGPGEEGGSPGWNGPARRAGLIP